MYPGLDDWLGHTSGPNFHRLKGQILIVQIKLLKGVCMPMGAGGVLGRLALQTQVPKGRARITGVSGVFHREMCHYGHAWSL
jgi:hypothetical protein